MIAHCDVDEAVKMYLTNNKKKTFFDGTMSEVRVACSDSDVLHAQYPHTDGPTLNDIICIGYVLRLNEENPKPRRLKRIDEE